MNKEEGDGKKGEKDCEIVRPLVCAGLLLRQGEGCQLRHGRAARSGHSPLLNDVFLTVGFQANFTEGRFVLLQVLLQHVK